jgi:UDP-N-acetyl-D-glucosamine dehydrogenase
MIESARLTEISTLNNILGKFQIELSDLGLDKNARILVYGVTYKDGVADIRESAGIKILTKLTEMGYEVYWFDPLIDHMPKFAQMTNLEAIDAVLITNSNPSEVLEKILSMELPVWDTSAQFKTHRKIGRL